MRDLLGIYEPKLNGELEGFEAFNGVKTQNWVLFYLVLINFRLDKEAKELILVRDLIKFYDIYGNEQFGRMVLLKNQIIVETDVLDEIYFVWEEY